MSEFDELVDEWQVDTTILCAKVIWPDVPDLDKPPLIKADEVCHLAVFGPLPKGLEYLGGTGAFGYEPEHYFFVLRDGSPVHDEEFVQKIGPSLERFDKQMGEQLEALQRIHRIFGKTCPTVIKTAMKLDTGEALTIKQYDELEPTGDPNMTAADVVFNQWINRIVNFGSAYDELND